MSRSTLSRARRDVPIREVLQQRAALVVGQRRLQLGQPIIGSGFNLSRWLAIPKRRARHRSAKAARERIQAEMNSMQNVLAAFAER